MHGSARSPGQWRPGRRGHLDSALLSDAGEEQGQRRRRHLRAGQVDDRSRDAQRGHPLRLVQFREPRVPPRTVHPDAEPQLRRAAFETTRYKDFTPKVAAAWDVFGDGKTASRSTTGKYVLGQALVVGGLASQPGYNVQLTSSRSWIDNDRNFVPDCDLTRNTNQGPTQTGIDRQVDTCNAADRQQTPTSTATH